MFSLVCGIDRAKGMKVKEGPLGMLKWKGDRDKKGEHKREYGHSVICMYGSC